MKPCEPKKKVTPRHRTELERIAQAEKDAADFVNSLPPDIRENGGSALLSDLCHEFLLSGRPSKELADQLRAQTLARKKPQEKLPKQKTFFPEPPGD